MALVSLTYTDSGDSFYLDDNNIVRVYSQNSQTKVQYINVELGVLKTVTVDETVLVIGGSSSLLIPLTETASGATFYLNSDMISLITLTASGSLIEFDYNGQKLQVQVDETNISVLDPISSYLEVSVSSAQIKAMGSTPVELLPAVSGYYYDYEGVIEYTHGTAAYVLAATDSIVVGNNNTYSGTYIQENLITNTANAVVFFRDSLAGDVFTPGTTSVYETPIGEAVQLFTWNAADPTTGDGTMKIKIWYKLRKFG